MAKKHTLGTGNRKHFVQRPNTSFTSPQRVRLWRRRAEAVALREQSLSYREIGQRMKCATSVAHELVVSGLSELAPIEQRENVRALELLRLEGLIETYFPAAKKGDVDAAKVYVKLAQEHSRLAGLYPQAGGFTINNHAFAGGNAEASHDAERFGIKVTFHPGPPNPDADDLPRPPTTYEPSRALPPPLELQGRDVPPAPKPAPRATAVAFEPPTDVAYESAFTPRSKHWMR